MNEDLKEKAKTLRELIINVCGRDICIGCPISTHHNCDDYEELVRLEDVEEACEKCDYREVVRIRKEEARELKQKLQQLLKEYLKERCAFMDGKISGKVSMSLNEVEWLKKFGELLK